MLTYKVVLEPDTNGTLLATCPDFPEVAAVGDDEQAALLEVIDAIETAIQGRISDRLPVPGPSPASKKDTTVALNGQVTLKALLHNTMLIQGYRKSDLAKDLGVHMPQVDRLLDTRHNTKLDALEAAFAALGKKLEVKVA